MTRSLHLALALMMTLASVALGQARGQVMVDGAAVLCSGTVLSVVQPEGGAPRLVICPDMAPGLLAGVAPPPPPAVLAPQGFVAARFAAAAQAEAAQAAVAPQARGPPRRV